MSGAGMADIGADRMQLRKGDALIVVDVQRDFLPDGSLGVPDGDAVRAVNVDPGDGDRALAEMRRLGASCIESQDLDVAA
jgi:hypothetical protein